MIGIYKITNLTNGKFYIGQSVNIERRFMEHKTPKSHGNDRLHKDIQELGIKNFRFEILEECNENDLKAKELYYIKNLQPFYNWIGKQRTKEEKKKISIGTKKWWDNLSDDKKNKIITKNLTGPKKGHEVSAETREKLRKWVTENQGQKVMILETGQVFNKIKDLEKFLGVCHGTCAAYWKGKIKTVKGFHIVKCRD
ncbi:GIY-YIG nuclease family protein [Amedibacillus dolichus]|uniref:GIY-YIG nuclease family protein n=1 Tax=Amedibacillus dolichus TaxID=31971 RepID=UPI001D021F51|nr:GIY-YIG nuclease family protein [Amedibacillus dolichus]MCB5374038.1 GIY-YIG nuclease family protein [Amedibacillus dolichus]